MSYESAAIVWINGEPYAPNHPLARAAVSNRTAGAVAKLERNPGDGTVEQIQVQNGLGRRFLIRIKSIRKRLLDEDNLCEKFHVDLLRHSGVIPQDSPGTAKIEVSQEKVEPGAAEKTIVQVWKL